ncbi:MAG: hypothetical protein L0Y50_00805 [Beijerinckiaceae bacterium]|nr:hypothetical protein [Beijerinckiaceae bacterium]MCI0734813.1 hypothetical protein [Beijerinckiaceae bacterium]
MTTIDRRAMLRALLGGAAAATAGLTLIPDAVDSAPLTLPARDGAAVENPIEQAVVVTRRAGRRPPRRPRTKCWYKNGKRVCASQYQR